jgi:hypothetical protein
MGKKIVFGCLGVALLVLIVGGYLFYTIVMKPISGAVGSFKEINQANEQVVNRASYDPPPAGEMTADQVERFVAVQSQIRGRLDDRLNEFQQKYDELSDDLKGRDPSLRQIMNVLGDVTKLYADAKRIQVDEINKVGFSLDEYRFVQQSFYQALGMEMFAYNLDAIAKAAGDGGLNIDLDELEQKQEYTREEVPEKNRQLVAPYAESADEWITFAWWGL